MIRYKVVPISCKKEPALSASIVFVQIPCFNNKQHFILACFGNPCGTHPPKKKKKITCNINTPLYAKFTLHYTKVYATTVISVKHYSGSICPIRHGVCSDVYYCGRNIKHSILCTTRRAAV